PWTTTSPASTARSTRTSSPPEEFHALNRVIDIIGAEITDGRSSAAFAGSGNRNGGGGGGDEVSFGHVPAYQRIRKQQRLVEEAIEHMAVRHCADLNSSVAAVGRMSRQFDEARMRVRTLRRQVRDVKDSLRLGELTGDAGIANVSLSTNVVTLSPQQRNKKNGENS
ncbi:hypothetical protein THAOC_07043, partial [Thalassiosira oceanica]